MKVSTIGVGGSVAMTVAAMLVYRHKATQAKKEFLENLREDYNENDIYVGHFPEEDIKKARAFEDALKKSMSKDAYDQIQEECYQRSGHYISAAMLYERYK